MKTKPKALRFEPSVVEVIQAHADKNNMGNFTQSITQLALLGLGYIDERKGVESEQRVKQKEQSQEESGGV